MKNISLLWSCAFVGTGNRSIENPIHCAKVWKQREAFLADIGIELKLLVPRKSLCRKGIFPVLDKFWEECPELLIESPGKRGNMDSYNINLYDTRLCWPRDSFQMLDDIVYTPSQEYTYTKTLLQNMNLNLNCQKSIIGEGGCTITTEDIFLISDLKDVNETDINKIKSHSKLIYKMPVLMNKYENMNEFEKKLLANMGKNGHIDTELNCIRTPDHNFLLTVNENYYTVFKTNVDALLKEFDAKLYILIDPKEVINKAVNFVQLPTSEILISQDYPKIIKFLQENLGFDRVHPIETFDGEHLPTEGGGGLRCRTNFIYSNN